MELMQTLIVRTVAAVLVTKGRFEEVRNDFELLRNRFYLNERIHYSY